MNAQLNAQRQHGAAFTSLSRNHPSCWRLLLHEELLRRPRVQAGRLSRQALLCALNRTWPLTACDWSSRLPCTCGADNAGCLVQMAKAHAKRKTCRLHDLNGVAGLCTRRVRLEARTSRDHLRQGNLHFVEMSICARDA